MAGWLCDVFRAVFGNLLNDSAVTARGDVSGASLRRYLSAVVAGPQAPAQTVLGRLQALQRANGGSPDNDAIRRNIAGIMAAMVYNTGTFLTFGMRELLRRPAEAARARAAAEAGDVELVRRYLYEAARFAPAAPLLARHVPNETKLAVGTNRECTMPAGSTLVVGILSALFDEDGYDEPNSFDIDHDAEMLHFGHGVHRCLGLYINRVQLPELAAALLRLPNLRLGERGGSLLYNGLFADRFIVEF